MLPLCLVVFFLLKDVSSIFFHSLGPCFSHVLRRVRLTSLALNVVAYHVPSGVVKAATMRRADIWGVTPSLWLAFCFRPALCSVDDHFSVCGVIFGCLQFGS